MTINKEISNARAAFESACDDLNPLLLDLFPSAYPRLERDERSTKEWNELYYFSPVASRAGIASLRRRFDALAARFPAKAPAVDLKVSAIVAAAEALVALKERKKAERAAKAAAPAAPAAPVGGPRVATVLDGRESIEPGWYLLVRYGNGTQRLYVCQKTSAVGLSCYRLYAAGTQYAHWRASWISRHDPRIIGRSASCYGDPVLPSTTAIRCAGRMSNVGA